MVPGLLDFCLYCVYNSIQDHRLYRRNSALKYLAARVGTGVSCCAASGI